MGVVIFGLRFPIGLFGPVRDSLVIVRPRLNLSVEAFGFFYVVPRRAHDIMHLPAIARAKQSYFAVPIGVCVGEQSVAEHCLTLLIRAQGQPLRPGQKGRGHAPTHINASSQTRRPRPGRSPEAPRDPRALPGACPTQCAGVPVRSERPAWEKSVARIPTRPALRLWRTKGKCGGLLPPKKPSRPLSCPSDFSRRNSPATKDKREGETPSPLSLRGLQSRRLVVLISVEIDTPLLIDE